MRSQIERLIQRYFFCFGMCVLRSQAIAITFQDRIQREVLCEGDCFGRFLRFLDVKHL